MGEVRPGDESELPCPCKAFGMGEELKKEFKWVQVTLIWAWGKRSCNS